MEISELVTKINKVLLLQQSSVSHLNATKEVKIRKIHQNLRDLHCEDFAPKLVSIGPLHQFEEHLRPMQKHKWRLLSSLLTNMDNHGDQNQNGNSTPTAVLLESVASQQQVEPANTNSNKLRCLVAALEELKPNAKACYSNIEGLLRTEMSWFSSMESLYAGDCYPGTMYSWRDDDFLLIMLLDGCFIIQLLRLYAKQCELDEDVDDPIFRSRWMLPILQHDLLLFENQLPFMVIEKIFNITSSDNERYSLTDLTIKFFNYLLPRDRETLNKCKGENEPHHLLGLFRSSFILSSFTLEHTTSSVLQQAADDCHDPKQMMMNNTSLLPVPSNEFDRKSSLLRTRRQQFNQHYNQQKFSTITIKSGQVQERNFIHSVTKLKQAGVVFKKRNNGDLLDIEFKNGKLYIPPLLIDDHTGAVLLNFVAYEQCNPSSIKPYFTQYLLFIECLLKSSKDVEHLKSEGIIDHELDSNEDVAVLFNKLCKELVHAVEDFYLSELVLKDVNLYTQVKSREGGQS